MTWNGTLSLRFSVAGYNKSSKLTHFVNSLSMSQPIYVSAVWSHLHRDRPRNGTAHVNALRACNKSERPVRVSLHRLLLLAVHYSRRLRLHPYIAPWGETRRLGLQRLHCGALLLWLRLHPKARLLHAHSHAAKACLLHPTKSCLLRCAEAKPSKTRRLRAERVVFLLLLRRIGRLGELTGLHLRKDAGGLVLR